MINEQEYVICNCKYCDRENAISTSENLLEVRCSNCFNRMFDKATELELKNLKIDPGGAL